MEIKKTKKASLENKKKSIFLFGLLTSLGLLLMAFEWANYDVNYELPIEDFGDLVLIEPAVEIIQIKRAEPPAQKLPEEKITEDVIISDEKDKDIPDEITETEEVLSESSETKTSEIEISDDFKDEEKVIVKLPPFKTIVPIMPNYIGGEKELYKYLGRKVKYTSFAREAGVQGKIYVQFIVEKDGSISNIKLLNKLDPGLERNAVKAIKEMKKWNPGKQRGQNVRVQMKIPISYKLD